MTTIDESLTAKGFTPAASVPQVFGAPRTIEGIVIHHWGLTGQTHDGVVNFFVSGPGSTSAHFVASAGRINCLVSPADAAWHCPGKNASTIGIECRPEATDEDYATVAELVRFLRGKYGALPLSMHRDWYSTACPGVWDLDRIDNLAGGIAAQGDITPTSSTPIQEDDMSAEDVAAIRGDLNTVHEAVLDGDKAIRADVATVHNTIIRDVGGQLGALRELVKQLATGQGVAIDYALVEDAAKAGAAEALANGIDVTVTVKDGK